MSSLANTINPPGFAKLATAATFITASGIIGTAGPLTKILMDLLIAVEASTFYKATLKKHPEQKKANPETAGFAEDIVVAVHQLSMAINKNTREVKLSNITSIPIPPFKINDERIQTILTLTQNNQNLLGFDNPLNLIMIGAKLIGEKPIKTEDDIAMAKILLESAMKFRDASPKTTGFLDAPLLSLALNITKATPSNTVPIPPLNPRWVNHIITSGIICPAPKSSEECILLLNQLAFMICMGNQNPSHYNKILNLVIEGFNQQAKQDAIAITDFIKHFRALIEIADKKGTDTSLLKAKLTEILNRDDIKKFIKKTEHTPQKTSPSRPWPKDVRPQNELENLFNNIQKEGLVISNTTTTRSAIEDIPAALVLVDGEKSLAIETLSTPTEKLKAILQFSGVDIKSVNFEQHLESLNLLKYFSSENDADEITEFLNQPVNKEKYQSLFPIFYQLPHSDDDDNTREAHIKSMRELAHNMPPMVKIILFGTQPLIDQVVKKQKDAASTGEEKASIEPQCFALRLSKLAGEKSSHELSLSSKNPKTEVNLHFEKSSPHDTLFNISVHNFKFDKTAATSPSLPTTPTNK